MAGAALRDLLPRLQPLTQVLWLSLRNHLVDHATVTMDVTFELLTDDLSQTISKMCLSPKDHPLRPCIIQPSGMVMPDTFRHLAHQILDMQVKDDDIWIITFVKSGTTWAQEMIWLLKNNIDVQKARATPLTARIQFIERDCFYGWQLGMELTDTMAALPQPRIIKTHLSRPLLPKQLWTKKPKVVFVFRNPKDVAISLYHHYKLWFDFTGSQDIFLKAFLQDKVFHTPFWETVLLYWEMRNEPNVLFMTYENMKKDLAKEMKKVAEFLGVSYSEAEEAVLLDHLSFNSMKNNTAVNFAEEVAQLSLKKDECFIRRGKAGGWRTDMSQEMVELFDQWTERKLCDSDFPRHDL